MKARRHVQKPAAAVPGYISTTEAGALIGCTRETVRRYVHRGLLAGVQPSDRVLLVSKESVTAYLASR